MLSFHQYRDSHVTRGGGGGGGGGSYVVNTMVVDDQAMQGDACIEDCLITDSNTDKSKIIYGVVFRTLETLHICSLLIRALLPPIS